jgi:hypothetical protein
MQSCASGLDGWCCPATLKDNVLMPHRTPATGTCPRLMVAFVLRLNIIVGGQSQPLQAFNLVMRWLGGVPWTAAAQATWCISAHALQTADGRVQLMSGPGHARPITGVENRLHYIALGAGVPITIAYLDYAQNAVAWPHTHTSGDVQQDMETVKAFYAPVRADTPGTLAPDDVNLRVVGRFTAAQRNNQA